MTVWKHAVSARMVCVPHCLSLSHGPEGSQLGQTRAGVDSLVQYIPLCRAKGQLDVNNFSA
jgi:hypothetical protein